MTFAPDAAAPASLATEARVTAQLELAIPHRFLGSNCLDTQGGKTDREGERTGLQSHAYTIRHAPGACCAEQHSPGLHGLRSCRYSASHCPLTEPISSSRCRQRDRLSRTMMATTTRTPINNVMFRGYACARYVRCAEQHRAPVCRTAIVTTCLRNHLSMTVFRNGGQRGRRAVPQTAGPHGAGCSSSPPSSFSR